MIFVHFLSICYDNKIHPISNIGPITVLIYIDFKLFRLDYCSAIFYFPIFQTTKSNNDK